MSAYVLHPDAYTDLIEIWDFIANDSIDVADRIMGEIEENILNLVAFPHQGHLRPDLTCRPLRFHVIRDFLLAYAPDEKPLLVVAILHGRRNPRVMAAVLRDRG